MSLGDPSGCLAHPQSNQGRFSCYPLLNTGTRRNLPMSLRMPPTSPATGIASPELDTDADVGIPRAGSVSGRLRGQLRGADDDRQRFERGCAVIARGPRPI